MADLAGGIACRRQQPARSYFPALPARRYIRVRGEGEGSAPRGRVPSLLVYVCVCVFGDGFGPLLWILNLSWVPGCCRLDKGKPAVCLASGKPQSHLTASHRVWPLAYIKSAAIQAPLSRSSPLAGAPTSARCPLRVLVSLLISVLEP